MPKILQSIIKLWLAKRVKPLVYDDAYVIGAGTPTFLFPYIIEVPWYAKTIHISRKKESGQYEPVIGYLVDNEKSPSFGDSRTFEIFVE